MFYFFASFLLLVFLLVVAPFGMFPEEMEDYGTYLTGLAAIGAALKFAMPYLLILFYRKRYSNRLIWKTFLEVESPENIGRVTETEWVAGIVNYFRRNPKNLRKENPWYCKLPYLSDKIEEDLGGAYMIGKKENDLFNEIRELFNAAAEIVAVKSTPIDTISDEKEYDELQAKFKQLVGKFKLMNTLLKDVPVPARKIIEGNDFYKSFFKGPSSTI